MPTSHKINDSRVVMGLILITLLALLIFFNPGFSQSNISKRLDANQVAHTSYYDVSLSNFYLDTQGMRGFKPSEDGQILVFDITIHNKSDQELDFLPSIQTYIRDNQGAFYLMKPTKLNTPYESGKISPHSKKNGQLSFEIPKRGVPLMFYLDSGWYNYAPTVFNLPAIETLNIKY